MELVVGFALVALGAAGATTVAERFEQAGRVRFGILATIPFGVLIGAGAAMARGYHLAGSMIAGGIVVPLAGAAVRVLQAGRRRRRSRDGGDW